MSSDRRREHAPELRGRLVAEMLAGGVVSAMSRREGICTSVLHRWLRRARREAGVAVAASGRLLAVRLTPTPPSETGRCAALLEVLLRNGRVLRVLPGADPAAVAMLAAALER